MIVHPQNIDKVSLRMNQLEFGYQDYAVALLSNLKKLEGCDLLDQAGKEDLRQMKEFVGKGFL